MGLRGGGGDSWSLQQRWSSPTDRAAPSAPTAAQVHQRVRQARAAGDAGHAPPGCLQGHHRPVSGRGVVHMRPWQECWNAGGARAQRGMRAGGRQQGSGVREQGGGGRGQGAGHATQQKADPALALAATDPGPCVLPGNPAARRLPGGTMPSTPRPWCCRRGAPSCCATRTAGTCSPRVRAAAGRGGAGATRRGRGRGRACSVAPARRRCVPFF
jgi:hypothetical protein